VSLSDGLRVRGLSTRWADRPVLRDVSFSVRPGEFVTLMGPNGSGKTTLLRAIAGLEPLVAGEISVDGRPIHTVPTHRRRVGLLFQEPTMLPRRTVRENIAYGPELQRRPVVEVQRSVDELLEQLHLTELADRPADELSGGERQRVALARTLAAEPAVVLLDEPFASVDAELRAELRAEFRRILRARGAPVLHVTHDREEGLFLGDRVLLLSGGRIVQSGPPQEVAAAPATPDVAQFLGFNLLPTDAGALAVRPESLRVGVPSAGSVRATVVAAGRVGESSIVYLRGDGGERWESRWTGGESLPREGERVGLHWTVAVRMAAQGRAQP
jgi:ABC-type Fe3+/spermidine/putrescine transport system ATPase subunit